MPRPPAEANHSQGFFNKNPVRSRSKGLLFSFLDPVNIGVVRKGDDQKYLYI